MKKVRNAMSKIGAALGFDTKASRIIEQNKIAESLRVNGHSPASADAAARQIVHSTRAVPTKHLKKYEQIYHDDMLKTHDMLQTQKKSLSIPDEEIAKRMSVLHNTKEQAHKEQVRRTRRNLVVGTGVAVGAGAVGAAGTIGGVVAHNKKKKANADQTWEEAAMKTQ